MSGLGRRGKRPTERILRLAFFLLGLILGLPVGVVRAHGGGVPQLTNAEAGPYWVSAWTQPDPLQVGQAHITVAVSEPGESLGGRREAGSPVLDATVQVRFEPLDHAGEPLVVPVTHKGAVNRIFYEADLELPQTGRWQAVIAVEAPDGTGSASFEVHVAPPQASNWIWVIGLGLVAVAAIGMTQKLRARQSRG